MTKVFICLSVTIRCFFQGNGHSGFRRAEVDGGSAKVGCAYAKMAGSITLPAKQIAKFL
jgi:hypothetical protein